MVYIFPSWPISIEHDYNNLGRDMHNLGYIKVPSNHHWKTWLAENPKLYNDWVTGYPDHWKLVLTCTYTITSC